MNRAAYTTTLLAIISLAVANAQDVSLDWSTLDGGGILYSVSPSFTLSGTIGQPDTDVLVGGDFEFVGGFWPIHCEADFDANGVVNLSDLATLLAAYGARDGDPQFMTVADFDGSGCIDLSDLANLLANYGNTCQ